MPKGIPWPDSQTKELNALVETIIAESGGNAISTESPTLIACAQKWNRTTTALSHKTRSLALVRGLIKTRKQKMDEIRGHAQEDTPTLQDVKQELFSEETPSTPWRSVTIPLKDIYGKVDFETFMKYVQ